MAVAMIGSSRAPSSAIGTVSTERGATVNPLNAAGDVSPASVEKRRSATTGSSNGLVSTMVSTLPSRVNPSARYHSVDVPFELRYTWTAEAEFRNAFESDFDPWGDVQVGDELPYIPEHQLRATAGLEASKWRFNIAANYVGKLRTRAGQGAFIPEESIDSHVVWDMVAAWQFTPQLSTYVKVDNLFDETYIAARRPAGVRPGLPRTAYLGLTYRL